MKITIRGEKMEVTPSIKEYAEEKISKINKYLENPDEAATKIVLKIRGRDKIVEVMIKTNSFVLRAEESHSDMYAAIDLVSEKLEQQIRKNKNKIKSRITKEKPNDFVEFEVEEEEIEDTQIVKRKNIELKPMDEDEAILQMELIGHSFFIFKNIDTESICVIYKRKDGQYGLIDTK